MRIFFSAGEPSGDQHAAHLIQQLQLCDADFAAEGFGGPEMRAQGCALLFELTDLAVMGFLRVVPMLAKFRRLVKRAERFFDETPPDAVVLVDFPGFNWWIARAAKKRDIPVYYFMPPQLWAWAPWRIRRVRKYVDQVFCALPFEYDWYSKRGVNATWVGHPFFDEVEAYELDHSLIRDLRATSPDQHVVAVLPGSRDNEVERNFPVMLDVVQTVSKSVPGIRWIVGNYRTEHATACQQMQSEAAADADITYFVGKTSEVIEASDCCFMVSGSISLELLARKKPGIVLYRAGRIVRLLGYVMMTCPYITLTNLIAQREIMPEFISVGNPKRDVEQISARIVEWCTSPDSLKATRQQMEKLANEAAVTGATTRTAEYLINDLQQSNSKSSKAA